VLRLSVSFWSAAAALPLSDCRTFPRIASGIADAAYDVGRKLLAGIGDPAAGAASTSV
jgi:hypothetical protein